MDLADLRYVAAAADSGNFTRAARGLGLNASTISRRIGRLEDELGLTLFERSRVGIRLTASGQAVMRHVRRVLADVDAVKFAGHHNGLGTTGEIRLGVRMPPIGGHLGDLLQSWHHRYPNVLLALFEMHEMELATALAERRLDAAFIPSFALSPHAEALPIYRERLVAALPANHPLARRSSLAWMDLYGEILLVQGWGESQAQREFFASLLGSGVKFQAHAVSKQSILSLIAAGFGATLAETSQAEAVFPGVTFKPIVEVNAWFRVDLVWAPESKDPVIGRFIAFMRDEAKERNLL